METLDARPVTMELLKASTEGHGLAVKEVFNAVLLANGWTNKSHDVGVLRERLAGKRSKPGVCIGAFRAHAPDIHRALLAASGSGVMVEACQRLQRAWRHAVARRQLSEQAAVLLRLQLASSARKLQRAWRAALASLLRHVASGRLSVLLVANLGNAGANPAGRQSKPSAETRKMHIHTTLHHAGQRAAFLLVNEYGWGSAKGPGGSPAVQQQLGLTLTTRRPTEPPPTLHGSPSSCWCYAAQEQVYNQANFPSYPGTEIRACQSFIASRHSGAFFLERMPSAFYRDLPNEAYEGRFVCCKATWCDERRVDWPGVGAAPAGEQLPSHFLLATWHGRNTHRVVDPAQVAVVQELCAHLRRWCDEALALCCVLAGDFNIVLQPGYDPAEFAGFERLDPDAAVRRDGCRTERPHPHRLRSAEWSAQDVAQWAGRRRYGADKRAPQSDVDHLLVYRPALSPLVPRRPRRFRMYDRARAGVLPPGAGATTQEHDGALDHDSLVLELWLG